MEAAPADAPGCSYRGTITQGWHVRPIRDQTFIAELFYHVLARFVRLLKIHRVDLRAILFSVFLALAPVPPRSAGSQTSDWVTVKRKTLANLDQQLRQAGLAEIQIASTVSEPERTHVLWIFTD